MATISSLSLLPLLHIMNRCRKERKKSEAPLNGDSIGKVLIDLDQTSQKDHFANHVSCWNLGSCCVVYDAEITGDCGASQLFSTDSGLNKKFDLRSRVSIIF